MHSALGIEIQLRNLSGGNPTVKEGVVSWNCTLPNGWVSAFDYGGVLADGKIFASYAKQRDEVAGILEAGLQNSLHIIDYAQHADDWSRQHASPFRLVVERDVAGDHGRVECLAGFSDAVDHFGK